MAEEELENVELFVITYNLVFKRVFYKGNYKISLLTDIFLRLNQVHMNEELVIQIVQIKGIWMIEARINGL